MEDHFKPGKYLAHVAWAAVLFTALALLAAGVGKLIQWIATWADDDALITVLTAAKYGILGIDIAMLFVVLITAAWHFVRSMFRRAP